MKNNNPDLISNAVGGSCRPSKKSIKKRLASALEAKAMIDDLHKNNYLPYPEEHMVRGHILIVIEDIKKQLKSAK